jgi:hypothetical protein
VKVRLTARGAAVHEKLIAEFDASEYLHRPSSAATSCADSST